eukprot:6624021-Pyramimonas_sp.AAC.1
MAELSFRVALQSDEIDQYQQKQGACIRNPKQLHETLRRLCVAYASDIASLPTLPPLRIARASDMFASDVVSD